MKKFKLTATKGKERIHKEGKAETKAEFLRKAKPNLPKGYKIVVKEVK